MKTDTALSLINAAIRIAAGKGIAGSASVVDSGGHLVAFARADGASFLSLDITRRKAFTSSALGLPTSALAAIGTADPTVASDLLKQAETCLVGGGIPIRIDGVLAGGLGVAGGRADQDHAIAEAAIAEVVSKISEAPQPAVQADVHEKP